MSLDPHCKLRQNTNLIEANIDGDIVMLDADSGKYFGLNPVASRIWALLADGNSTHDIVQTLVGEYSVDEHTCLTETSELLADLLEKKLVFPV